MNPEIWRHPAVQRNVETLRADGYLVLDAFPTIEVATRELHCTTPSHRSKKVLDTFTERFRRSGLLLITVGLWRGV